MKFFHTADWHLGKIVQGVHMTEDQRYVIDQFIQWVEKERPDAVIIAGDLYDRAVPPTEAVHLLNDALETIVIQLKTPVLAIAGNHDSPERLHFGHKIMQHQGFHIVGKIDSNLQPIVLHDDFGEVHFHLVPYMDPSFVQNLFPEEEVRSHHEAMQILIQKITENWNPQVRHVFVGHAFVTPYGEAAKNTSDSERPLSIGGAEYVEADLFNPFHYTALGHLHRAHFVKTPTIHYSGSILKYSISEEHHKKGFNIVHLNERGEVIVEKKELYPRRDLRTVEASMAELLTHPMNDDYVFVRLTDESIVLSPMEKIRSVYPNALHVERKYIHPIQESLSRQRGKERSKMDDVDLFKMFYEEVEGKALSKEQEAIFIEMLDEGLKKERELVVERKED